jgi:hypothetical protein
MFQTFDENMKCDMNEIYKLLSEDNEIENREPQRK